MITTYHGPAVVFAPRCERLEQSRARAKRGVIHHLAITMYYILSHPLPSPLLSYYYRVPESPPPHRSPSPINSKVFPPFLCCCHSLHPFPHDHYYHAQVTAAKETAAKEKAAKEKAAKEKAAREASERAAKEKAERAAKEKAAQETAAEEKAARQKAVKEKAEREAIIAAAQARGTPLDSSSNNLRSPESSPLPRRSPRRMEQMRARIEWEERERAETEARIRAEVRGRLHGSSSRSTGVVIAHEHSALAPRSYVPPDEDVYMMRRKIARLEGEQRIQPTPQREGELEATRFDLRNAMRNGMH